MKKVVKITAYTSLVLFLLLSILIQFFSLQNNTASGVISNGFSKKLISMLYGDQQTKTPDINIKTITLATSVEGEQKTVGTTTELISIVTPENATEKLKYYSSDPAVASVDNNGKVTFKAPGKVDIYASNTDKSIVSNIIHYEVLANHTDISDLDLSLFQIVALDNGSLDTINVNELKTVTYLYNGNNLPLNDVSFKSSDNDIISIFVASYASIFSKKQGQATITMFVGDTPVCSKEITVTEKTLKKPTVAKFRIDDQEQVVFSLELGDIYDLDIEFIDEADLCLATFLRLKEGSDSIIKVNYAENMSRLRIKCAELGKQTIELVSFCDPENPVYEFTVNVLPKKSAILGIDAPNEIYVDKAYKIKLKASDPDTLHGWKLSCQSPFATISDDGKITFTNTGKYTVTYTSEYYPEESYDFTVIVKHENYLTSIRKGLGHAGLFALLAVFATLSFGLLVKSKAISTIYIAFAGLFNAVLSEIFQLPIFASGRSARFIDVVIDFSGYLIGFLIISLITVAVYFIAKLIKKKKG